jgi:hypothetical protein
MELARRGAIVYASDIDGKAVEKVAGEIGSNARAKRLDVRDASAVAGYVADIHQPQRFCAPQLNRRNSVRRLAFLSSTPSFMIARSEPKP